MQIDNLPKIYLTSMKELFKEEFDEFLNSYNDSPLDGININLKKTDFSSLSKKVDFIEKQVPWSKSSCYTKKNSPVSKSIYYYSGLYYIQEPSASLAVNVLNPQSGEKVLDMCASPGGKTFEISNSIGSQGFLVSNDINFGRTHAIVKNMQYFGLDNMLVTNLSQENLSSIFPNYFDKILIDAPCSGEGMFRKKPKLINGYLDIKDELPEIQKNLLENASKMLKPGGELVYSTCTFSRKENEDVILDFLDKNKEFEIVDIPKHSGLTSFEFLKEAVRALPHKVEGEGHFVCKLKKVKENTQDQFSLKQSKFKTYDKMPEEFKTYIKTAINYNLEGNFIVKDSTVYMEKFPYIFPKGLRIITNGICLGDIKNKKFTPTSHFIRSLNIKNLNPENYVILDSNQVEKYFKGESFTIDINPKKNGIFTVVFEEYPVGYCKVQNGRLKNCFEKAWRML